MAGQVDLYNNAYARVDDVVYRQIRTETYGRDLGQTSWVSTEESREIPELLQLTSAAEVLEIGCGSGLYAMDVARRVGCRVTGLDLNPHGIASATQLAKGAGQEQRVRFKECDVSHGLEFEDQSFHAAFANDVLCHIAGRAKLLEELFRVLRPGARLLFSDALVVGGMISHVEIATRSSIGTYFYSPAGENERLLMGTGFAVVSVRDTSQEAAEIAQRWHDARQRRSEELLGLEGNERFEGLQRFLECVRTLTQERRLLRYLYVAEKPGSAAS